MTKNDGADQNVAKEADCAEDVFQSGYNQVTGRGHFSLEVSGIDLNDMLVAMKAMA